MYDYLIIGSGLFGSTFARLMSNAGKKCLIIEKRNHFGGNVFTENIEGIHVHKYGAHIFHTNDVDIWNFVNSFVPFNHYVNSPLAFSNGKLYNLPFNMNTFYQLWGVTTPADAQKIIQKQINDYACPNPKNLEEQAINLVGSDIYHLLIKEYTEKQWGRTCAELPPFIIKRLPIRFTFNNNYFSDKYQGIPIGGYTTLIEKLLDGIEVKLNTDFFANKNHFTALAKKIVYSGPIDQFYDFEFGTLAYRSLHFENNILNMQNYQGNAVVNYISKDVPYTRIIEHKHFEFGQQEKTVITKEYPVEWSASNEPYYPVNDVKNEKIANQYRDKASSEKNIIFGGRLAEYRYYDMHQVIGQAMQKAKKELNES